MAVNSFREDEKLESTDKKKIILRLFRYLKEYTGQIIVVLLAMGVTVGINLVNPLIIEYAIDVHVKTLRHKLGDFGNRIKTVRNVGYVIE